MKELSIEEKAKAYDEAINVAEKYHNGTLKDVMETIFPEFMESEDERIRKKIIATIHLYYGEPLEDEAKEMIAWLEKQGENRPTQIFKIGDMVCDTNHNRQPVYRIVSVGRECYIYESNDKSLGDRAIVHFTLDNPYLRLVEQKPAWSEKDEIGLCDALWAIQQARTIAKDENDMGNLWYAEEWLKSLIPQNRWKPSELQLECLGDAIKHYQSNGSRPVILMELLKDLKKLK